MCVNYSACFLEALETDSMCQVSPYESKHRCCRQDGGVGVVAKRGHVPHELSI
jgi:hypothetical protein